MTTAVLEPTQPAISAPGKDLTSMTSPGESNVTENDLSPADQMMLKDMTTSKDASSESLTSSASTTTMNDSLSVMKTTTTNGVPTTPGKPSAMTNGISLSSSLRKVTDEQINQPHPSLTLPAYRGPHSVGACHFEAPPMIEGGHGVLATLFYPCDKKVRLGAGARKKTRWLPGPKGFYATGYGDFMSLPRFITKTLLTGLMGKMKMPAYKEAELSKSDALPAKLPLIIYSHGLAGTQTTYSTYCGNLASRGFIVLSLEHRDTTAAYSARNAYKEKIPHARPTAPNPGETVDEYLIRYRTTQIKHRAAEVREALILLRKMDGGEEYENMLKTSVVSLKDRVDWNNCVVTGHSFGGATALAVMQDKEMGELFKGCIALDPWMFAVPPTPISKPILSVQSHHFHWKPNMSAYKDIHTSPTASPLNTFGVVIETMHQEVSDMPAINSRMMKSFGVSSGRNPALIQSVYDHANVVFLKKVLGSGESVNKVVEDLPGWGVDDVDSKLMVWGQEAWDLLERSMPDTWEETQKKKK
ncbi:Platelet-activating factor acetylhydrolase [Chytridiales sp. JEL 0842]|nr:Platelet-activating factor acetylhydrolase [Chytridiales sp. JEL 0842]